MSANVRASCYMMLSMMGFTVNDSLIKSLGGELPVGQVMAMRGIVLSLLIFSIVRYRKLSLQPIAAHLRILSWRTASEIGATIVFLNALVLLPFATITAILQSLPLAVAVGAALFLAEPIGWRRWIAIGIGFIGVLIIIRPGLGGFAPASLLVVLAVLFATARDLITRKLPASLPSLLVTLTTAVTIAVAGALITTVKSDWQPASVHQLAILTASACFLFFGYHFVILAMRTGDVAYVVPFRYSNLIWAVSLGYIYFNEVPDRMTLIGASLVIATGLFTLYREVVAGRKSEAQRPG